MPAITYTAVNLFFVCFFKSWSMLLKSLFAVQFALYRVQMREKASELAAAQPRACP